MNDNIMPQKVAILVKKAALEFSKMANPVLAEHEDLTSSQYKVIKLLYRMENHRAKLVDIERHYSLTHPTAIGLADALEKKGFVTRKPNPLDARSRLIVLTQKADDMQEELETLGDELEDDFTKNLTEAERETLVNLLQKLLTEK